MQGIVRKITLISREILDRTPDSVRDSAPTPIQIETKKISSLTVAKLKKYMREKGETIRNTRKPELVYELVRLVDYNTFEVLIEYLMQNPTITPNMCEIQPTMNRN